MADEISDLQHDYLAEIYQIAQLVGGAPDHMVTSSELAARLDASQSTVNRVIERLRSKHLITHERYVGVQLTAQGINAAEHVLRKQAIIEAFLVHTMGFAWHEIYEEARRIRRGANDRVVARMWALAGEPVRSPFGDWIDPAQPAPPEIPLIAAEPNRDYHMARVFTRQADRLSYLAALGLQPGVPFRLLHKAPFNGPLQIQLQREYRIIGYALARLLTVLE